MKSLTKEEFKEIVIKEIEHFETIEHPSIEQQLKKRNLLRNLALMESNHPEVWCEQQKAKITNLMACMFCSYGHMMECHYPYTCDSQYCNHYDYHNDDAL